MKLEDLRAGVVVMGLASSGCAKVLHSEQVSSDSFRVTYEHASGLVKRLVFRSEEVALEVLVREPSWDLAAGRPSGSLFRLVTEALRIRNAHHFDRFLALQTSAIEPLPHQITAVYEDMLHRQPLRYLLADDPGSGKTIMSGMYIKELLARSDCRRCLIVAPGNLVEQWHEELWEKFKLDFELLTSDFLNKSHAANPFNAHNHAIVRLDVLARSKGKLRENFENADDWDLIICDEAHRMSAKFHGEKLDKTKRYQLGEELSMKTRNLLFLTATPHSGKPEDFRLFMALLGADVLKARSRTGVAGIDTKNLIRRLTKEDLRRFDGTPLFPARHAKTVAFELSPEEQCLYDAVTKYVRYESNLAEYSTSDDRVRRRLNVNFALQILQRRLASSPNAIYQSLRRKRMRLEERLAELQNDPQAIESRLLSEDEILDIYDLPESEIEKTEAEISESVTSDNSDEHLQHEVIELRKLENKAQKVLGSQKDTKWLELKRVLDEERKTDETGNRPKLIIFTEARETLDYLADRVKSVPQHSAHLEVIHGGIPQHKRREIMNRFLYDRDHTILIATDATGEGVNLQSCHLMVNYDLPWNPNRIEQRFGRIHRIGQTIECHLWNLVAKGTREGDVCFRLLEKLEQMRIELHGQVYDVLGELLDGESLKDLLWDAIQHADDSNMAEYIARIDEKVNIKRFTELIERNRLTDDVLHKAHIEAIHANIRLASIQALQPHYIQSFFEFAFVQLGGKFNLRSNEKGRYSIKVPEGIRQASLPNDAVGQVQGSYYRICFDKQYIDPSHGDRFKAEFICPGHPLLDATVSETIKTHSNVLAKPAIMIDDTDEFDSVQVVYLLELIFNDGRYDSNNNQQVIEKLLKFVRIEKDGNVHAAGFAPHLNFRCATDKDLDAAGAVLDEKWLNPSLDNIVQAYAAENVAQEHLDTITQRQHRFVENKWRIMSERLNAEIRECHDKEHELKKRELAGNKSKQSLEAVEKRRIDCQDRLHNLEEELDKERHITVADPKMLCRMIVIPRKLLCFQTEQDQRDRDYGLDANVLSSTAAIDAVIETETRLGRKPKSVLGQMLGYDVISSCPKTRQTKYIKVASINDETQTIAAVRTEILASLNLKQDYILAIVRTGQGNGTSTEYAEMPFGQKLPPFETAVKRFPVKTLLNKASKPH